MTETNPSINELQSTLNEAARLCATASEGSLAFVHGWYTGIVQGITAMGYIMEWHDYVCRFTVRKDPLKTAGEKTYAQYLMKIMENHFMLYLKGTDPVHEQAIMDGMEEVLRICGYSVHKSIGPEGFVLIKTKKKYS